MLVVASMCGVPGVVPGMIIMRGKHLRMRTGVRSDVPVWPIAVVGSLGDARVVATLLVALMLIAVLVFVRVHTSTPVSDARHPEWCRLAHPRRPRRRSTDSPPIGGAACDEPIQRLALRYWLLSMLAFIGCLGVDPKKGSGRGEDARRGEHVHHPLHHHVHNWRSNAYPSDGGANLGPPQNTTLKLLSGAA
jgi:hypothetical protein